MWMEGILLSVGIMRRSGDYYKRLMWVSGALMLMAFIVTFLMVIRIIPEQYYIFSFLTYAVSFFGLYLFLYAYYQYVSPEEEASEV